MLIALLSGLGLGFAGSILAGPTSVVIVESALDNRPRRGLAIAGGAAIAEGLYAFVAFWGLTAFLTSYPMMRPVSRAIAGVVLCLVGVYLIRRRTKPAKEPNVPVVNRDAHELLFGFTITLINPTLAVTWAVAVAALDAAVSSAFGVWDAFPFALGVSVGIVGWFWVLLRIMCRFRKSLPPASLNRIMRGTGVVLVAAGLFMTGRVILRSHIL
jgi:threonine/homoserine/homoserine lactone efflux protein